MRTRQAQLIIFLLLFIQVNVFACINGETKILKNGVFIYEDHEGTIPYGHQFNRLNFENVKRELDSLYKKTHDLDYLSDIGYVLIIEGKYSDALAIYLEIEKKAPNRYSTASNIGTIYELLGDDQKAYTWIQKAIRLNPNAHDGSEWLHLKILEAKLNKLKNPDSNFFFSTSFGTFNHVQTELSDHKIERLIRDIYYQLNERITFIKEKDVIIAHLLFELGNLCLLEGKKYDALQNLKMAKEYGLNSDLLNRRIAFAEGLNWSGSAEGSRRTPQTTYKTVYNPEKTILLIISLLAGCALLVYACKTIGKKRK